MKVVRNKRTHAEAERATDAGAGTPSRRSVLGSLAAFPVLYSIGSAAPARLDTPAADTAARPSPAPQATGDLVRGTERRYQAPLLTAGTRLSLPAGMKARPVLDPYHRPHLARAEFEWPYMRATDGAMVDASIVPERGAPSRVAVLSGFAEGWYEVIHASGRADRVTWDVREFPFLWLYGEFGATTEAPYHNWYYALALQPMSRNPYSQSTVTS